MPLRARQVKLGALAPGAARGATRPGCAAVLYLCRLYLCLYLYVFTYIYIYIQREREIICIYIYIYIHIHTQYVCTYKFTHISQAAARPFAAAMVQATSGGSPSLSSNDMCKCYMCYVQTYESIVYY